MQPCGMGITMSVRPHLLELGPPIDEGAAAWEMPRDVMSSGRTPLLAGVDPFGYTVFNRVQIDGQLPREIALLRLDLDPTFHRALDELERLIAVAKERVHRYVWFEGD